MSRKLKRNWYSYVRQLVRQNTLRPKQYVFAGRILKKIDNINWHYHLCLAVSILLKLSSFFKKLAHFLNLF